MHGINGMWPRRSWCWLQCLSDVTVITRMHMQVMYQSLLHIRFASIGNSGTSIGDFRFALPAWNLFTEKTEVEPDLSLMRDKFSVRYDLLAKSRNRCELWSFFRFHYSAWFFRVFSYGSTVLNDIVQHPFYSIYPCTFISCTKSP